MKPILSVSVIGARGRMGRLACDWIREAPGLSLLGELDLGDRIAEELTKNRPMVALDFTTASAARENALAIVRAGVRPVIGTSGLSTGDVEALRIALEERQLGGIVVPNFSIGAVLMMRFAEQAARFLPHVEILEAHHPTKEDAPSGTARATAARVAKARSEAPQDRSKELVEHVRGGSIDGVRVHSIRLPGVVAHQEVRFGGPGEQLSIRHDSTDRSCFRDGVLLALRAAPLARGLVMGLEPLLSIS